MSILRTHNLQNPDSSSINIVMDQGGNTNITGVTTVGGSNFHVPSGSVGIGTDSLNGLLSLTAASGRILTLRNSTTGFASGDGSYLALNGSDLQISNAESANLILYTGDAERLRITSAGLVRVPDSGKFTAGASDDLQIYHDGSWNYIQSHNSKNFVIQVNDNENAFVAIPDGEVQLYHNNVKKFETTATGTITTGIATVTEGLVLDGQNGSGKGLRLDLAGSSDYVIQETSTNDVVQFGGTGSSNFFVHNISSGKIGIGTNSANHKLTLFQSGTGTFDAINFVTGNTNSSGYQMGVSSGGEVFHWNTTNSSINFATNNAEKFRITTNVGPWAEGDKGHTRGTLHLRPEATDHMGGAITFGASDSGGGHSAMAGIYTRSDGTYGTRMYFATTNSYATGPKNAMFIDEHGYIHDSKRPYIYGSVTNTNGSGVANDMQVVSSRNLSFSNSRITVPVSGVYHICFNTITDTGTGRVDAHIRVNGSGRVSSLNDTNTSGYHYRGMSISLMLSANDYIEFNNNDWYDSTNTNFVDWRTVSVVFLG